MGVKNKRFRLKKSWFYPVSVFATCLALGVYLYIGFQPIRVDASDQIRLSIPSISLNTPVNDLQRLGDTLAAPEVIAGAYQENPNKTLLIGHSSTVFKRLSELQPGDTVIYDQATYRVSQRQILPKEAVDMQQIIASADQPTLILMTCAGQHLSGHDYSHRLIITAE